MALKGPCRRLSGHCLFMLGSTLGLWFSAGPLVLALCMLQVPMAPACFSLHATILDSFVGLVLAQVAHRGCPLISPVEVKGEEYLEPVKEVAHSALHISFEQGA